jgi:hypothetical protein
LSAKEQRYFMSGDEPHSTPAFTLSNRKDLADTSAAGCEVRCTGGDQEVVRCSSINLKTRFSLRNHKIIIKTQQQITYSSALYFLFQRAAVSVAIFLTRFIALICLDEDRQATHYRYCS